MTVNLNNKLVLTGQVVAEQWQEPAPTTVQNLWASYITASWNSLDKAGRIPDSWKEKSQKLQAKPFEVEKITAFNAKKNMPESILGYKFGLTKPGLIALEEINRLYDEIKQEVKERISATSEFKAYKKLNPTSDVDSFVSIGVNPNSEIVVKYNIGDKKGEVFKTYNGIEIGLKEQFTKIQMGFNSIVKDNLIAWLKENKEYIEEVRVDFGPENDVTRVGCKFGEIQVGTKDEEVPSTTSGGSSTTRTVPVMGDEFEHLTNQSASVILEKLKGWGLADKEGNLKEDFLRAVKNADVACNNTVDDGKKNARDAFVRDFCYNEKYSKILESNYNSAAERKAKGSSSAPKLYHDVLRTCTTKEAVKNMFVEVGMATALHSGEIEFVGSSTDFPNNGRLQHGYRAFTNQTKNQLDPVSKNAAVEMKSDLDSWRVLFWLHRTPKRVVGFIARQFGRHWGSDTKKMAKIKDYQAKAAAADAVKVGNWNDLNSDDVGTLSLLDLSDESVNKFTFYRYYERMLKIINQNKGNDAVKRKELETFIKYFHLKMEDRFKLGNLGGELTKIDMQNVVNAVTYAIPTDKDALELFKKIVENHYAGINRDLNDEHDAIKVNAEVVKNAKALRTYLNTTVTPSKPRKWRF